ncbi:MAG: transposase [Bacteroidales bacterium]
MATKLRFESSRQSRQMRYFSEEFKKQKVRDIERNLCSIRDISKEYQVSTTAIYRWVYKYSHMRKKGIRQVVESESDAKKVQALKEKVKELERIIGQKQLLLDFQSKVIEIAEQEYKVDIKKKFGDKPFSGTGITEENTV